MPSLKKPKFTKLSQPLIMVAAVVMVGIIVLSTTRASSVVGDLNNDGTVNVFDLSILLSKWGTADTTSDLNHDGAVNIFDLSALLTHWGQTGSTPTPTPSPTHTPTPTPTPTPSPTGTPVSGGGICTNPIGSVQNRDTIPIPGTQYSVRNEAWNDLHGPQTTYACSEKSWYTLSNQPNNGGQVETYPDSSWVPSSNKTLTQYTSITSTFGEAYPAQGDWNAAYDLWFVKYGTDAMIWNEWNGSPGYWQTQAKTAVTLGGVPYHFLNNDGELMFFRDTQVKSGSVDLLAAYKWLIAQGYISSTDSIDQIDYGLEICNTNGATIRYDTTDFSVTAN